MLPAGTAILRMPGSYLKVQSSGAPKRKKKYHNDHLYLEGSI